MNVITLNIHTARKIRAHRMCINGQWQLRIAAELEDNAETAFSIYADTREALDVIWSEDEHVRITGGDNYDMESGAAPFDSLPSREESPNG